STHGKLKLHKAPLAEPTKRGGRNKGTLPAPSKRRPHSQNKHGTHVPQFTKHKPTTSFHGPTLHTHTLNYNDDSRQG
ncbi:MAG: hypothetical protein ACKPKO_04340, partial [Candidatus Fonsibacter sp.]